MKKILLAICMILASNLYSQVTITQNEMPHSGDSLYRTRAANNPFLNYAATDTNFTWNFTNLVATTQDSALYQTVASTNFIYALTFIDIAFNPNRANHAKPGVDIPFNNLLPVTNPYTFNYRNASIYKTVGFGMELSGIPVPVIFTDHDEIYNLPINYGDTDSSFSAYNLSIPTLAYYGYEQSRMNEVDGWGVINTPSGTFDVLRVKTTKLGRDTISIDSLSVGFSIDRAVIREYKWLSPGLRIPVMQVNTTELFGIEIITDIFFYDLPRTISVVQPLANTFCAGSSITVPYEITGAFNAGGIFVPANIFRVRLSDANGDFTNGVIIGTVTTNLPGTINCTIPANTPAGTGYRIRVEATNPAFTGSDNGFDISIAPLPVAAITANGATEFCEGDTVVLSAISDSTYTYQWQLDGNDLPLEVNPDYTASIDGLYTVEITNGCGSVISSPMDVIVNPLPEHIFSQTGYAICNNNPAIIFAQNVSGQDSLTLQWYGDGILLAGETTDSLTTDTIGNYTLEITNLVTGCFYSLSTVVAIDSVAIPLVNSTGNLTFCDGDSVLLDATIVSGTGLQWQLNGADIVGATDSTYTALVGGTYTVVAIASAGCTASSTPGIDVVVNALPLQPVITASGSSIICSGDSVQLDVIPEPGASYQWLLNGNPIATGNSYVAADSGSYSVIATAGNGCINTSAAPGFEVLVNPIPVAPIINVIGSTDFCQGDSVVLWVVAVIGFNYQWTSNGTNIPGAIYNQLAVTDSSGMYTVNVTDMVGCSNTANIAYLVNVNPLPAAPTITQVNDTLYAAGTGNFQWYVDGSSIPGAVDAFYVPLVNGNYSVTVTDANGCSSMSVILPVTNVGIYEAGTISFAVFPNPSSGLFELEFENTTGENYVLRIMDPAGKLIVEKSNVENHYLLNLTEFASGIYFLEIQNSKGEKSVTKLIKQ